MKQDRIVTDLLVAIKQLQAITPRITELQRRDTEQVGPDGYGDTVFREGTRGKGDHADPTHSAALATKHTDTVHDQMLTLLDALKQTCDWANKAAGAAHRIEALTEHTVGRVNLVDACPVCGDPMPQPRAGFDDKCYRRFIRACEAAGASPVDRGEWIQQQRRERAQEDVA